MPSYITTIHPTYDTQKDTHVNHEQLIQNWIRLIEIGKTLTPPQQGSLDGYGVRAGSISCIRAVSLMEQKKISLHEALDHDGFFPKTINRIMGELLTHIHPKIRARYDWLTYQHEPYYKLIAELNDTALPHMDCREYVLSHMCDWLVLLRE